MDKNRIQMQVIQILCETDFSLNVVNRYKENILHVCAANNCIHVIKYILQKYDKHSLERKNAFGWTPLMQAIRNENYEMVKFLLSNGIIINDFSFLGMSVLSFASAISINMFNLLYNNNPSALEYAAHDDINPLCVAALKNDQKLFYQLISLGLDVCKANAFTLTIIKQSTVLKIAEMSQRHLSSENFWSELSDIRDVLQDEEDSFYRNETNINSQCDIRNSELEFYIPKCYIELCEPTVSDESNKSTNYLNLNLKEEKYKLNNISPTLSYSKHFALPVSPNTFITSHDAIDAFENSTPNPNDHNIIENNRNLLNIIQKDEYNISSLVLHRCQNKRPPNLKLRNSSNDSNITLSFTPQFSPSKTPDLPQHISEENVFDELIPTPPKYKTPPRGIVLDPKTKNLVVLLEKFGLRRHIPVFVEQEVDLDLFLNLTDKDLFEIGINNKTERLILLSVIRECKNIKM